MCFSIKRKHMIIIIIVNRQYQLEEQEDTTECDSPLKASPWDHQDLITVRAMPPGTGEESDGIPQFLTRARSS